MQIILDYKYCVKVNIFRQSITKIKAKIQNYAGKSFIKDEINAGEKLER